MKIIDLATKRRLLTAELIPDRVLTRELVFLHGMVDAITIPALQRYPEDPSYPVSFNVTPQQRSIASALIVRRNGIESIPSITCRDFHKSDLSTIPSLLRLGLDNLLVLFGDPLPGTSVRKYGFAKTRDLIQNIVSVCETRKPCLGAVTNQYARNREDEISRTLDKVDAGADFIVTNIVFDAEQVLDHIDGLNSSGLTVPLLVQVSIPSSVNNLKFVRHKFDIPVPERVLTHMAGNDDPRPGVTLAAKTYQVLKDETEGVHFSYLLRSRNPIPIYQVLLDGIGLRPTLETPPVQPLSYD